MARRLRLLGIGTLAQLARLPAGAVSTQFGRTGYMLRRLAEGRDNRPVVPHPPPAVERAEHQFDSAVGERAILDRVLQALADELSGRLQREASMCRSVALALRLDDGTAYDYRLTLRQPVSSAGHLTQILSQLLDQAPVPRGVTGLEVSLSDLVPAVGQQLDLFVHQTGQDKRLRQALRNVVARYGTECLYWIRLTDPQARLPERSFRLHKVDRS
jgi:DNA polymerase-4